MTSWRSRIVRHGEESPDQLLANPANWRIHPRAQEAALEGVLEAVGWVQSVIVNERTGHVVDGHLRVAMAISQGALTVPVVYVDLSPEEEALILATLDPLGAMAVRDDEKLNALLADASADGALGAMLETLTGSPRGFSTEVADITPPKEVSAEGVQASADHLAGRFAEETADRSDFIDLTCPECGGSFSVKRSGLMVSSRV